MTTQQQTSSAAILSFIAGFLASKFTFFDAPTWLAILSSISGLGFVIYTAVITRKNALVTTVSNMDEVTNIDLDKTKPGSADIAHNTPANVKIAA